MTPHPTLRRLNSEWAELARLPVPAKWTGEPALAGLIDLAGVLAAVRAEPDAILGALLRRGDSMAWRVVLQAMLGRAVRDAARDREHDLDDYVGELWLGIAGYPLHRRPARIAANLALDTAKRVRSRPRAIPTDPARLALVPARPAGRAGAQRRAGAGQGAAGSPARRPLARGAPPGLRRRTARRAGGRPAGADTGRPAPALPPRGATAGRARRRAGGERRVVIHSHCPQWG